jgi:hypothetical protein
VDSNVIRIVLAVLAVGLLVMIIMRRKKHANNQ